MEPNADAEKMAALKKAYADVILNTTKESAARILAAERRALRFQQSLFLAKEEALATMLRLKSLMDSKIKEADMTSLYQAKRIHELEVQLNEAEYTIGTLKEELQRANNESKIGKIDSVSPLNENEQKANGCTTSADEKWQEGQSTVSCLRPAQHGNLFTIDIMDTTTPGQKNKDTNCCFVGNTPKAGSLKHLLAERDCGSNSDMTSIITRSKEPELYRNGCTQRIRAFEHNIEQIAGEPPSSMNVSDFYGIEKVERSRSVDSPKVVKIATRKARNSVESEGHAQSSMATFCRFSARKPRTRCIYVKPAITAISHDQDARHYQLSEVEGSLTKPGILATKSIIEELPHKFKKSHSAPISSMCGKNTEDKKLGVDIISGLLACNNRTGNEKLVVKENQDDSWNKISQSFAHHMENKENGNNIEDLTLPSTVETQDVILLNGTGKKDEEKFLGTDGLKMSLADQNIAENSDALHIEDNSSAVHSISEAKPACESVEALPEVVKDKFLKYTFQRTRKKGSLYQKNESIAPEKISGKRKVEDKHNVLPEPPKPSLATDFPRNDRRLMQVARQLISLSEKRW